MIQNTIVDDAFIDTPFMTRDKVSASKRRIAELGTVLRHALAG